MKRQPIAFYRVGARWLKELYAGWYLPNGGSWESCWPCRRYPDLVGRRRSPGRQCRRPRPRPSWRSCGRRYSLASRTRTPLSSALRPATRTPYARVRFPPLGSIAILASRLSPRAIGGRYPRRSRNIRPPRIPRRGTRRESRKRRLSAARGLLRKYLSRNLFSRNPNLEPRLQCLPVETRVWLVTRVLVEILKYWKWQVRRRTRIFKLIWIFIENFLVY